MLTDLGEQGLLRRRWRVEQALRPVIAGIVHRRTDRAQSDLVSRKSVEQFLQLGVSGSIMCGDGNNSPGFIQLAGAAATKTFITGAPIPQFVPSAASLLPLAGNEIRSPLE